LAEWLLGDTCNLIGCLLTGDQLRTMVATAMFFICADVVLVLQFIVYTQAAHLAARRDRVYAPRPGGARARAGLAALAAATSPGVARALGGRRSGGTGLLLVAGLPPPQPERAPPSPPPPLPSRTPRHSAGLALAWASSGLYLGSRVSQLTKNAARGSADGLALSMFGAAIAANTMYGASILLRARGEGDVAASAPWLAGSLGTILLDCAIFAQARALAARTAVADGGHARRPRRRRAAVGADGRPLLGA